MDAFVVIIILEIAQLAFQVDGVPKQDVIEIHPMGLKQHGFAAEEVCAPETIFCMTDCRQPRRTVASRTRERPIMLGQNSPDDILVYVGAEGFVDLFCDSWAAKPWIAFPRVIGPRVIGSETKTFCLKKSVGEMFIAVRLYGYRVRSVF